MSEPERSLWTLEARQLLNETASAAPTPGGGSVAALTGALGLGLVVMALDVSARRKKVHSDVGPLLARARTLLSALADDADADVRAFSGLMAVRAQPGDTAERAQARERAALTATETPLLAAEHLVLALELARESARSVARGIVSDVGAGTALLGGALRATLLNVDINLPGVASERRPDLAARRAALLARGEAAEQAALSGVSARLEPSLS